MSSFIQHRSFFFEGLASDLLEVFLDEPFVFLLESSLVDVHLGRYSFLGFDPFEVFQAKDLRGLNRLEKKFDSYANLFRSSGPVFPSGIVGYLGYDQGVAPQIHFGFYDRILVVDHLKKRLSIYSSGMPEKSFAQRRRRAKQRLQEVMQRLKNGRLEIGSSSEGKIQLKSNFSKKGYGSAVKKALDHIAQGDIYQVNLSQKFSFSFSHQAPHPIKIYQKLQSLSPSCFGGYLDVGKFQIISSSPERFLHLQGRNVETRPMKGTRPRGEDVSQDAKLEQDLLKSRKDIAELLMITDLERNDLGQVCEYGSVKVKDMRTLEKYQTVFQATSTIIGKLRKDKNGFDLLRACFPGGSITGCPKIRAMEIIRKL
ncbi:MAG: anthranilate synthase component I family protein, partial [Candidatus Omnitrophica bacterium]|nr:anthranilate synthase component I family protein [Candidatus Omnitrophota bacterium]